MNGTRNIEGISAKAVPQYAVIGPSGDAITGFDSAIHAADWARRTWPHLEQDPDRTGKGWDIQVSRASHYS